MIYRAGILGILMAAGVYIFLLYLIMRSVRLASAVGLALSSILFYWVVSANFAVVLELPDRAIPFWSLCGMALSYVNNLTARKNKANG